MSAERGQSVMDHRSKWAKKWYYCEVFIINITNKHAIINYNWLKLYKTKTNCDDAIILSVYQGIYT